MPLNLSPRDVARYWAKVDVRGPDDCWPWKAGCFQSGYGLFRQGGYLRRAHRVAYKLAHPEWDESQLVCHTCDNPPCQNERHFFLGSHADNHADRNRKGRQAKGDRNGGHIHPHKLTAEKAACIRILMGTMSQREIAILYGVHQTTVSQIHRNKRWAI